MEAPGPARLYATLVGALLVTLGIVGFFYSASFGSPGELKEMLGFVSVNAWVNCLHVATGALGLLVAGFAARRYALCVGLLYLALAVWGFALGAGEAILGFLPVDTGGNLFHLALGVLGIFAALARPQVPAGAAAPRKAERRSSGGGSPSSGRAART